MQNKVYTFASLNDKNYTLLVKFVDQKIFLQNPKDGRNSVGTLLDGPRSLGFSLIKKDFSHIDIDSISRFYNIEYNFSNSKSLIPYNGRFIIYKNGTCEFTAYGSGLPVVSTEYGVLK